MSGSMEPERVAITSPSSGLKPMLVSMDRPWRTAVAEAPPPRWHTTSRPGPRAGASSAAARSAAHSTDRPWNPWRRTSCCSRQAAGTAYTDASSGMPAWKAVSNTATWGTPGNAARASSMQARAGALWSGATPPWARRSRTTWSSIRTGATKRPPNTIRCPTATIPGGASVEGADRDGPLGAVDRC